MRTAWRSGGGVDRHAVPVEMRFIDMFMAALGALVFMAMLLAFILKYLPPQDAAVPTPSTVEPLDLLTKVLPAARVGEPYEMAFAYRGGSGAVRWEVAGAGEIPAGMRFDHGRGVLAGTPVRVETGRFVVTARDTQGMQERPYTLVVEPARTTSRAWPTVLAALLVVVILLISFLCLAGAAQDRRKVGHLEAAWGRGEPAVQWQTGPGVYETIELPDGIATYRTRAQWFKRVGWYLLLVDAALLAFVIWRLWLL